MFALGLILVWGGATAFGVLLILRGRWNHASEQNGELLPSIHTRRGIETLCLFGGIAGMIGGLGLIALFGMG